MSIRSFRDLYYHQLRRLHATAYHSAMMFPSLQRAASCPELASTLEEDVTMANDQMDRLVNLLPAKPDNSAAPISVTNLLQDCLLLCKEEELNHAARDAALIDLVRRLHHDQIAGLSSARTWARAMRDSDAVAILEECLREEKQSDARLDAIGDICCRRAISCCDRCSSDNFCAGMAHA